jgi:hypothetical protein
VTVILAVVADAILAGVELTLDDLPSRRQSLDATSALMAKSRPK